MSKEEFVSRVDQNRPKLLRLARRMLRAGDCEDAVQSAILSAWEHLEQLRDERVFGAWLTQILMNRCRQIQREYQREKETRAALLTQERETDKQDAGLDEAMEALGEEERRLIRLHHQQGYSVKELAAAMGKSEDVLKMRLYRARNHLRMLLISLLLLILLASVAIGTGMIDVNWFLQNRRAEPAVIGNPIAAQNVEVEYAGTLLEVSVSDAVWDADALSVSFVYSIAGKDAQTLTVHSGNIGVDGMRFDHIWTDDGIVPVQEWAGGKPVRTFSVDGWRLGGMYLTGMEDYLPDGLGETFIAELNLNWIGPDRYENLLDADGRLAFSADVTLEDHETGELLEAQTVIIRLAAPAAKTWRDMYETYYR